MRRDFRIFALAGIGLTAACATVPAPGDPAVPVYAVAETQPVVTANEDAA
ncbi:MAG TPA: 3-phytase, partial [Erythrobacter sp.]|nr:3-phytase [Erythrobacter sp.]